MNRFVRPLLLLAVPLAIAAVLRIAPLSAQETAPAEAPPPPAAAEPPAERPPSQDDIAPEAAPGDRISADNNVSFPVDI
jgi:hypothetical protein